MLIDLLTSCNKVIERRTSMKRKVVWTLLFIATLLLGLGSLAPSIIGGEPRNPTLFEKRFQANQIAAFFAVEPDIARQWVPPPFELVIDKDKTTGKETATGALVLMSSPDYCLYSTPNSRPLEEGENYAPDSVVHFWFLINGPAEILPVPGAQGTAPTAYYYDVVDLVTNPAVKQLYRRAGRPASLVRDITLDDQGQTQTAEITFLNGGKITINANTPVILPQPFKLGGNFWQWHVGGNGEMGNDLGVRLEPATGKPSNVSTTHGQYLGLTPGPPNSTKVTIQADPGTSFEDCFGMSSVQSLRATFFRPNNIVLNASRGDLEWTTYPSPLIPVPPDFPEP
jgi:hypothetical protein